MARKHVCPPQGAPEWVLTYGDMMSLLLCFFIMLAALANFDERDKELMAAIEAIRDAFGVPGQAGNMPDNVVDFKSMIAKLQTMYVPEKQKSLGESTEPGTEGEYYRVKRIREGLEVRLGGPVAFDRFRAVLRPTADAVLRTLAEQVRGHRNRIEIRGHATVEPLPEDSPYSDDMDLAYARARVVRDRLIELGVDPRVLRVSAAGANEPILTRAYTPDRLAVNRRVEIVVMQATIDDFEGYQGDPRNMPEQMPWKTILDHEPTVPVESGSGDE
ncbi:MAG: OmpA family protein [Phycisphaerae bacterium]|nr:OmpA family protein [Phycisphaerae bacterium]NUQ48079.1 OmpA family protein [Phycisphaerae bacterium]